MQRIVRCFASVGVLTMVAGAASAADLPVKAPVRAAPAVAVYNWTGVYIGGHVGGVWGDKDWAFTDVVGVPIVPPTLTSHRVSGVLGGVQGGINWQTGNWVLGVEVQWSWTGADGQSDCPAPNLGGICKTDVKWVGTLAPRVGYAWNNILIYGKGGVAWAKDEYEIRFAAVPTGDEQGSHTRSGWMAGGGIEVGLWQNWSIKAEYNHIDLGKKSVRLNRINTGVYDETAEISQSLDIVKVGLNYRFGWGGPVVARY